MKRVLVISDVHGNLAALEAIVAKLPSLKPDQVAILGDHALFGPKPAETIDLIRKLQSSGALVTAGTGDIAVAEAPPLVADPAPVEPAPRPTGRNPRWPAAPSTPLMPSHTDPTPVQVVRAILDETPVDVARAVIDSAEHLDRHHDDAARAIAAEVVAAGRPKNCIGNAPVATPSSAPYVAGGPGTTYSGYGSAYFFCAGQPSPRGSLSPGPPQH